MGLGVNTKASTLNSTSLKPLVIDFGDKYASK
jgi:hypothetical protein